MIVNYSVLKQKHCMGGIEYLVTRYMNAIYGELTVETSIDYWTEKQAFSRWDEEELPVLDFLLWVLIFICISIKILLILLQFSRYNHNTTHFTKFYRLSPYVYPVFICFSNQISREHRMNYFNTVKTCIMLSNNLVLLYLFHALYISFHTDAL